MAVRQPHERSKKRDVRAGRFSVSLKKMFTDLYALISTRRPGILVLINDADWELEGEDSYEVQAGDNMVFVSTLHGG